mgnify:CR=1 FL=1
MVLCGRLPPRASGATLTVAVNVTGSGLDLATSGVILMIVGVIGLVTSLAIFGRSGFGGRRTVVTDEYVEGAPVVRRPVDY